MKNNQEFKKTEQFAIEEEKREEQWQKEYGEKLPEVIEKMDRLLEKGTEESRRELHDMFLDKNFFEHYKQTDTVALMYVVMEIYEREQNSGITNGVLEQGKNVEQLLKYLQTLKFLLYRIDFTCDGQVEEEFLLCLKQYNTSTIILESMLTTVVMRPILLALKLEQLFERNLMYKELFFVYNFINQRYPGNYRVLRKMAELYLKVGYRREAEECLKLIPFYPEEICGEQEEVFILQEKLWKLRYMQKEVCLEIVAMIKQKQLSREAWKIFLENEPAQKAEYYLLLVDAMLNEEMQQIAWDTLITGERTLPGNEMILSLLAELCVERGEFHEAVGFLERIENPSDMVCRFLTMCKERIR